MVTRWHHCTLAGGGGDEVTSPPRDSCRYYCMYVRCICTIALAFVELSRLQLCPFFRTSCLNFGLSHHHHHNHQPMESQSQSNAPPHLVIRAQRLGRLQTPQRGQSDWPGCKSLVSSARWRNKKKKKKKQAKRKTQGRKCVFWSRESLSML